MFYSNRVRLPTHLLTGLLADRAGVPQVPIPPGGWLELPGRGRTWLTDTGPRDAPPVVLLHAIGCTGMLTWFPTVAELSRTHRVITFDQRRHGRAELDGTTRTAGLFSLPDCADDVAAVITALSLDRPIVAGYSMGGVIAQRTWRQHPELVGGLVLAATTAHFRATGPEAVFHQGVQLSSAVLRAVKYGAPSRWPPTQAAARAAEQLTADVLDDADTPIGQWALREFLSTSPWTVAQVLAVLGRHHSTPWLPRVDVPTAVVVTRHDRVIPADRQRAMAALIPGSTVHEADCGHAGCVLSAAAFVPAFVDAVASVEARVGQRSTGQPSTGQRSTGRRSEQRG